MAKQQYVRRPIDLGARVCQITGSGISTDGQRYAGSLAAGRQVPGSFVFSHPGGRRRVDHWRVAQSLIGEVSTYATVVTASLESKEDPPRFGGGRRRRLAPRTVLPERRGGGGTR